MPLDTIASMPSEAGGVTHDLALQPLGSSAQAHDGADLDLERFTYRCNVDGKYKGRACCTELLALDVCHDKKYIADAAGNCHKFFYWNSARGRPRCNAHPLLQPN